MKRHNRPWWVSDAAEPWEVEIHFIYTLLFMASLQLGHTYIGLIVIVRQHHKNTHRRYEKVYHQNNYCVGLSREKKQKQKTQSIECSSDSIISSRRVQQLVPCWDSVYEVRCVVSTWEQFAAVRTAKGHIAAATYRITWTYVAYSVSCVTRSSAIAEGPRDASCQWKSCQLPRNSAETTYTTSPDQIDGMKLQI